MYPRTYYETFMRYEASNEVFVAMPFTPDFQKVLDSIVEPAITRVRVNKKPLKPRVVNRGTHGSPDIHEQIFDAIIHSRLVIADMTVQACVTSNDGKTRWQPNANVAYEVGLAAAWRNPEDILLIHQTHESHAYSFDIQNLRHVQYDPRDTSGSEGALVKEIVSALNQSSFISKQTYMKVVHSLAPSVVQLMHQESRRAFPVIAFSEGMPIMDARIHALSELLALGALKSRNVLRDKKHGGVTIVYQWTELGLRLLASMLAITPERWSEMKSQIASVPDDAAPPRELMNFPPESAEAIEEALPAPIDEKLKSEVSSADPVNGG